MPYFLRGKCVWKGTKEDPIKEIKCHETRKKALAHMAALYVHVEKDDTAEFAYAIEAGHVNANVGSILESSIHRSFTVTADHLYGLGYLNRDERIKLSGAIGDSLDIISSTIDGMDLKSRKVESYIAPRLVFSVISAYKEEVDGQWIDRWVTISTTELWDIQEQLFTMKAMDYDIARAVRTGNYPELLLFHMKKLKLGMCDSMQRIEKWAVEQGYWLKTPLAQAMKDIVGKNEGKWKVSRGFYPVEAAGLCPECDAGLTVGLWHHILGVRCPTCKEYHADVFELNRLKYFKTITFDLSLTDVPVTPGTAVTAYSLKAKQEKE